MKRNMLDHKVISTPDAYQLAKFVFDLTLKGYEPLPLQCNRQYGNTVITMALYEGENNESTEESDGLKSGSQADSTIGNESTEAEIQGTEAEEVKTEGDGTSVDGGSTGTEQSECSDIDVGVTGDDTTDKPVKRAVKRTQKPKA